LLTPENFAQFVSSALESTSGQDTVFRPKTPGTVMDPIYKVALGLLLEAMVFAQTTASLEGIIRDPSSSPIPNADVGITELATKAERSARTDPSGRYSIVNLAPGYYQIEVLADGL